MNKLFNVFALSFLITVTLAKSIDTIYNKSKPDKNYLIFVNNTYGNFSIFKHPKNIKRDEVNSYNFVYSLIDTIDELIVENKDTYKDPEKLEELENNAKLEKREIEGEEIYIYEGSSFVRPISCVKNSLVLMAYLSDELVKPVEHMENVVAVVPDSKLETPDSQFHTETEIFDEEETDAAEETDNLEEIDWKSRIFDESKVKTPSSHNYNEKDILEETQWKNVTIKKTDNFHLSLLSQSYNKGNLVDGYDQTYYYPSSGGQGVNVILMDNSFNFKNTEFSNKGRTAKCLAFFVNNRPYMPYDESYCGNLMNNHGQVVSVMVGGQTYGAAPLANVYGVAIPEDDGFYVSDILLGLQLISYYYIIPNRTILNLSLGGSKRSDTEEYKHYKAIIDEITEKGAIIVVSAGNDTNDVGNDLTRREIVPCNFENTICVGGIESNNTVHYENNYKVTKFSNYGKRVDLYAPAIVNTEIYDNFKDKQDKSEVKGTSFSAPLTAGVIATIMSDHSDTKFTKDSMLDYLLKNALPFYFNEEVHYIVNNGKRTVLSETNKYYGCGVGAGNISCDTSCSVDSCNLIDSKKVECKLMNGLLIYDTRNNSTVPTNYACLVVSNSRSILNEQNSICFENNDKTKCIYEPSTSFEACKSGNSKFDADTCIEKVNGLMDIAYNDERQEKHRLKCENEDGIFLTDEQGNYVCISHYHGLLYLVGKYCVLARSYPGEPVKRVYCANQYYSNLNYCDPTKKENNRDKCIKKILEMSSNKLYDVKLYLANPEDLY